MNENISQYLFRYLDNPDPRYAVMLKGKWGCGKSFFIKKWINQYKTKLEDGTVVLEPIYISLYGLKDVSQVTSAIDRIVNPFLYSKGAELAKKILKIAGKIAFRTKLDWDNDGSNDVHMDATLDSFSLLSSKDNTTNLGTKLIIFDDIERCLIDIKLILGYINSFVEHGACHVIIVGDETHLEKDTKTKLFEFKEKTVGREFEVLPDVDAAIDCFISEETPLINWLVEQKRFIIDCFKATNCNNLRLLRQCLYDFSSIYCEIGDDILEIGESFTKSLLGSYIVTYCEYRGEFYELLKSMDWTYFNGIFGNEATKERSNKFQNKYTNVIDKYQIDILNLDNIKQIIYDIETGFSIKCYVEKTLNQMKGKVSVQEKLANFMDLTNDEFAEIYNELEESIKSNNIPNMYFLGRSLALFVFFDNNKIRAISEDVINATKVYVQNNFALINNKEELYQAKNSLYQGIHSYGIWGKTTNEMELLDCLNEIFENRSSVLKNKMEMTLLNLTNDNVDELIKLSNTSLPDQSCCYNMTSIFENINVDILAARILNLNNKGLSSLCTFFSIHYDFGCRLGNGCNRYKNDLSTLQYVSEILRNELPNRSAIDNYALNRFLRYLDGAIKRANGECNSININ